MINVVKTPIGQKIVGGPISATIDNAAGEARLTSYGHGLTTGEYIYVESDIDEYNGFWFVAIGGSDTFRISEYNTASRVEYFQDADVTYYRTLPHEWSSIFLPITYKLTNYKWPINSVDPIWSITTADDNGFLDVTASGTIRSGLKNLEFVKITDSPIESYNGVWQIIDVISDSRVVIDAPYTASSLSGANIQYYYNNYQVKVKVFAGLPPGHPWESRKPYEEVAELSFTPDNDNMVLFSVADYIKSKVAIKNNTTLYSLPINLDAFTAFYISTGESFDNSDNYTLTSQESVFTDDSFVGYAITSKLPFKNVYSGHMSDYIWVENYPGMWLTAMPRLMAVEDKYFDISFIKNVLGSFRVIIDKYISDYRSSTEEVAYDDKGIGVYRIPIAANADYDSFCIRVETNDRTEEVEVLPDNEDLSAYSNTNFGPDNPDWTIGATLSVVVLDEDVSEKAYIPKVTSNGATLRINYNIDITFNNSHPLPVFILIKFVLSDTANGFHDYQEIVYNVPLIGTGSVNLESYITVAATDDREYFGLHVTCGADSCIVTVNSLSFGEATTEEVEIPGAEVTGEICIDILESCDAQGGIVPIDIRLLEDGSYRILE